MQIDFIDSIKNAFIKAFDFKTRSSRAEFWYFYLFTIILGMISSQIDQYLSLEVARFVLFSSPNNEMILGHFWTFIYFLCFIPSFSLYVRRLHDTDKSGWWLLIMLIPFIGFATITIFCLLKGDENRNQYGDSIVQ
tara:strand:+ start:1888 stop:2295 length:408 start_codon:yes stop_codon:yes gene_type:complete